MTSIRIRLADEFALYAKKPSKEATKDSKAIQSYRNNLIKRRFFLKRKKTEIEEGIDIYYEEIINKKQ